MYIYTTLLRKKYKFFVPVGNSQGKIKDCFIVIGYNIAQLRKRKKITQEELGFDVGLDKSAISHIEKGKPITVTTLLKIAAALEVDVKLFFENLPKLRRENLC